MLKAFRAVAVLVSMVLVAAGCAAPRAGSGATTAPTAAGSAATPAPDFTGKTLNVVTGGPGGVYIVYGAGLAELLNKKLKTAAAAQSTAASVANMQLIRDGKADIAFTLSDTAYDAVQGKGATFTDKKVDAKALAVLYTNFTHIIAKDGAGINTVADLKGKRVSVGAAASGTEIIANRILEAYGIDPATGISRERLGIADSANALRDSKIDAFFWSGGLPTAQVADLANAMKLKFIEHQDATKKMADKYGPFYFDIKIPKGTYKLENDVTASGVANILAVPSSMDAALARAVLTTMFDGKADLELVHAEARNLKLETAVEGSPIDYHPGAIDFYKSKGVWKK